MRRSGFTIALIGADGAGKTTLAHHLAENLPGPTLYLYLGINPEASTTVLPLTRFLWALRHSGRADLGCGGPRRFGTTPRQDRRRGPLPLRSARGFIQGWVRLLILLLEEWYRQVHARRARTRGATVILDRHFYFDYYAHDVTDLSGRRSLFRRIHGWFLTLLPLPDLVLILDAPPHVLYGRKPEGELADIVRRREEYLAIARAFPNVRVIDAARSPEEVEGEVVDIISSEIRPRWPDD